MGRTPLSGRRLLRHLRRAGLKTTTFGYSVILDNFDAIVAQLRAQIASLATIDDYIVVGHSLGGVLLRAALNSLPPNTKQPQHVYLLGSPVQASRLATRLQHNWLFQTLTRDCGHLLGCAERMAGIASPAVPVTAIVGTRGIANLFGIFGDEVNDGLVSITEVCAPWVSRSVQVPVFHTLLPASANISQIILQDWTQCAKPTTPCGGNDAH